MATNEMVYSYLESLLKLSNASAVNLSFPKEHVSGGAHLVCYRGKGLLPEFDGNREQIVFPRHCERVVFDLCFHARRGKTKQSRIPAHHAAESGSR